MARLILPAGGSDDGTDEDPVACSAPIRFVVDSGWRPVVTGTIDGVEVAMLLHANAGFVAMLTHDALYRVAGRRVSKEREFGLGHDLQLSDSGRGQTEVATLTVAGCSMSAVRFEVFDLPTTNWECMLGVEWLAACGAVVDFGRARLTVPLSDAERAVLSPYDRVVPMAWDGTSGRFVCGLSIAPDGGNPGRFVVSTVAETTLDVEYARRHGIDLGKPVEVEHGPTGAVVPVYRPTEPVSLLYDSGVLAVVRPSVYDIYGYGGNTRPAEGECLAGYLGADLLLEKRAIVDFSPDPPTL